MAYLLSKTPLNTMPFLFLLGWVSGIFHQALAATCSNAQCSNNLRLTAHTSRMGLRGTLQPNVSNNHRILICGTLQPLYISGHGPAQANMGKEATTLPKNRPKGCGDVLIWLSRKRHSGYRPSGPDVHFHGRNWNLATTLSPSILIYRC